MSKRGEGISEEKAKRIAVGATVGGVLLILFLVVILIVQLVHIGAAKKRSKELDERIDEYAQNIQEREDELDCYKSGIGLYWLARQNGFK